MGIADAATLLDSLRSFILELGEEGEGLQVLRERTDELMKV